MGPASAAAETIVLPHGTAVTYSRAGRRFRERDRYGHDLARLAWREDGALAEASVRIPDGTWLTIEPRATEDAPWGASDRLWRGGEALTVFAAVDYARIGSIPTLAEPARVPPGGGTAVLNLIASLATDQRCPRLVYPGPYPGEQLFLALLESFRYEGGGDAPLAAFMRGDLAWVPTPHERLVTEDGIWIQMREEIEKVVWKGRPYYRREWQGIRRHAPRCLREVDGRILCSLEVLGTAIEDHLRIDPSGEAVEVLPVAPPARRVLRPPPAVLGGVAAAVAARSAPPLGAFIQAAAEELTLEWGPVAQDLARVEGQRLRVTNRLVSPVRARLAAAATSDEAALAALAAISELAHLAGDVLRARGQARLAALPPAGQAAALDAVPGAPPDAAARALAGAVQALLDWPPLRDDMDDQLDVEGDEGANR